MLLLLLTLPGASQAQFTYATNNGALTITSYTCVSGPVTIPSTAYGLPVTAIGGFAFQYCSGLTKVTIPNSVTTIGNGAFEYCNGLTSVALPNSVTNIGTYAFSFCTNLTSLTVDPLNNTYSSVAGVLFNKSQTTLIQYPPATTGCYAVPDGVTTIGDGAFGTCRSLSSISIPDSVTTIGAWAFSSCSGLASITLPTNLTTLGFAAFMSCSSLTAITIPDSTRNIDLLTFQSCSSLTNVSIGNGVTNIEERAFMYCSNLTAIAIPNRVARIGNWAFMFNTGLTSARIADSVTSMGTDAFASCYSLTNVSIGNGVTNLAERTFGFCSNLTVITMPKNVTTIANNAFYSCANLTGIFFQGNAPGSSYIGLNNQKTTVYYLPGTTGWSETFSGRPAKLWNPMAQASGPNFGVRNDQFGFNITGTADIPIVVEACTDLVNAAWQPLQTCTLTNGSVFFGDPAWTSYPSRIYRIRSL